ncbi:PA5502 family lipoprotein [Pseudomonas viridiflava]|uniref:PA5502 family lipoprotein n=1 Tax=Pseudomonas viridiflava TaxID=33069 RepID=UPI000F0597B1|nr:PA5502 family lipoprotein [Pseudomonas viridiflava]
MKPFAPRYLLLVAFSILLGACQSAPTVETPASQVQPDAFAQLEQNIASNELATAEDQLATLQAANAGDIRLEPFQRRLAEAYLSRSQISLQKGDMNAAASALSRARALMPKAPALTSGVNGAIAHARKAELEKAEADLKAAEDKRVAKLVDPSAESTNIELKIGDMRALRHQLDDIAADTVAFNCDVLLVVPRTEDYPWLATLLTKRVVKANPDFELQLRREIERNEKAHIVLTPARS